VLFFWVGLSLVFFGVFGGRGSSFPDGEKQRFSMTQCYAMMLGELNRLAIADAPEGVNQCDVVLTVPSWYDDRQRREVKAACGIAQVQDLGLINDSTAVA